MHPPVATAELRYRLRQLWLLLAELDVERHQAPDLDHDRHLRVRAELVRLLAEAGMLDEAQQRFLEIDDYRAMIPAAQAMVRAQVSSQGLAATEAALHALPTEHHLAAATTALAALLTERGDLDGAERLTTRAAQLAPEGAPRRNQVFTEHDARRARSVDLGTPVDEDRLYALARQGLTDQAAAIGWVPRYRGLLLLAEGVIDRTDELRALVADHGVRVAATTLESFLPILDTADGPESLARLRIWAIIGWAPLATTAQATAGLWQQASNALRDLYALPLTRRSRTHRELLHILPGLLGKRFAAGGNFDFLDNPGGLAEAFTDLRRHPGRWRRALLRDRLRITVLVAATGGADWLAELPYVRGRRYLRLDSLVRLWTDPTLEPYHVPLDGLLTKARGERRAYPTGFVAAWVELSHDLVAVDAHLVRHGLRDGVLQALRDLRRRLGDPDLDSVELAALAARIRALVQDHAPIRPGSDIWHVVVDYRRHTTRRPEFRGMLDSYEQVVRAGGSGAEATRAARAPWEARLRATLGDAFVLLRETAPGQLLVPMYGQAIRVGISDDLVDVMHFAHELVPRGWDDYSCLDLLGDMLPERVQDYELHPRIEIIFAWREVDGIQRRLAAAPIVLTQDQESLLPLDGTANLPGWDLGPAFSTYLTDWAETTGYLLARPSEMAWPSASASWLTLPEGAVYRENFQVRIPADGVPSLWSDLTTDTRLPTPITQGMTVWTPPTPSPRTTRFRNLSGPSTGDTDTFRTVSGQDVSRPSLRWFLQHLGRAMTTELLEQSRTTSTAPGGNRNPPDHVGPTHLLAMPFGDNPTPPAGGPPAPGPLDAAVVRAPTPVRSRGPPLAAPAAPHHRRLLGSRELAAERQHARRLDTDHRSRIRAELVRLLEKAGMLDEAQASRYFRARVIVDMLSRATRVGIVPATEVARAPPDDRSRQTPRPGGAILGPAGTPLPDHLIPDAPPAAGPALSRVHDLLADSIWARHITPTLVVARGYHPVTLARPSSRALARPLPLVLTHSPPVVAQLAAASADAGYQRVVGSARDPPPSPVASN